jgi:hypothetical protein
MRNTLILLFLFLFTHQFTFSQSNQPQKKNLAKIRKLYSQIQQEKTTYDTTKIEVWDESTEGGDIVKYYKNGELKLGEKLLAGEMFRTIESFYFEEELFFVLKTYIKYNRPIYYNKGMAKENNDNEWFNPEKFITEENRYYFQNQKLFLWIDEKKNELKSPNKNLVEAEKNILKQINSILHN